jgi:hypothetical protein
MSSLNSPDLTDIVRTVAFGGKLRASDLRATGVDVEHLSETFKIIKPELNFFSGQLFVPLAKSFEPVYDGQPWDDWIKVFDRTDKFDQVVMLAFVHLWQRRVKNPASMTRNPTSPAMLRIYLSKRGEWIVWTNYPESRFEICRSPERAMEIAAEVLGEDDHFHHERYERDPWPRPRLTDRVRSIDEPLGSLALEVEAELARIYDEHIIIRMHQIKESRDKLDLINGRVDNIEV